MLTNRTERQCWLLIHPCNAPNCCSRHSDLEGLAAAVPLLMNVSRRQTSISLLFFFSRLIFFLLQTRFERMSVRARPSFVLHSTTTSRRRAKAKERKAASNCIRFLWHCAPQQKLCLFCRIILSPRNLVQCIPVAVVRSRVLSNKK